MKWTAIAGIVDLLKEALKGLKTLCANIGMFFRKKKSDKKDDEYGKAVEDGDVDKINDVLRDHKS